MIALTLRRAGRTVVRALSIALLAPVLGCSTISPSGLADGSGSYAVGANGAILPSPLGDYLAANFALSSGEFSDAVSFYERALKRDPGNVEISQQLFLLTLASGQYETALERAEDLAEVRGAEEATLLLSLDEIRDGDFDDGRELIAGFGQDSIASLAVPFIDAWAVIGEEGETGRQAALDRLDAGTSLGPLNDYHAAMIHDLTGNLAAARAKLERALPDEGRAPTRMVQAYASVLARVQRDAEALNFVREQIGSARDQPLLEEIEATLVAGEVPPRPIASATAGMADALLGIGEALYQERNATRAAVFARLSTFIAPDLSAASLLVGDIFAEQENLEDAIGAYQEIAGGDPLFASAQLRTARALHGQERKEEAYALLEDLADQPGSTIEPLVQLGDLLRREEAYRRAEAAYTRALEKVGEPEAEDWTLLYARGITYERTKRWPQAEADFLQALELEPEQPFVLNYLGYSWVDMGMNLDEAQDMIRRAVELRPTDGFIVDSLGWVYYRLGKYEEAVEQLEEAVELEAGDPVINDHLGDAYWQVGREREARFQWERALTLEPEPEEIGKIERKLEVGLEDDQPKAGGPDRI